MSSLIRSFTVQHIRVSNGNVGTSLLQGHSHGAVEKKKGKGWGKSGDIHYTQLAIFHFLVIGLSSFGQKAGTMW